MISALKFNKSFVFEKKKNPFAFSTFIFILKTKFGDRRKLKRQKRKRSA
jgi:hypothetical protein